MDRVLGSVRCPHCCSRELYWTSNGKLWCKDCKQIVDYYEAKCLAFKEEEGK